jgi:hypothetical protein
MVEKIDRRSSEEDGKNRKNRRNNDKYIVCFVFISKWGTFGGKVKMGG